MKILIVEDDQMSRKSTRRLLEMLHHTVFEAESELSARNVLGSNSDFDMIFMDGSLSDPGGGLDTLDFVKAIIKSGFYGKIVAFSGNEDHNKALVSAGCVPCGKTSSLMGKRQLLGL